MNGIGLGIGRLGRNWDFGKRKTWAPTGNSDGCSGHMAVRLRIAEKYKIYADLWGERGWCVCVCYERKPCVKCRDATFEGGATCGSLWFVSGGRSVAPAGSVGSRNLGVARLQPSRLAGSSVPLTDGLLSLEGLGGRGGVYRSLAAAAVPI